MEDTAVYSRKISKTKKICCEEDKIDIVHKVLIEGELVADVAKEYRISKHKVYRYLALTKKQPNQLF
jgi:Mor family transcriptional regulator